MIVLWCPRTFIEFSYNENSILEKNLQLESFFSTSDLRDWVPNAPKMDRPPAGSQPHKGVKCNVAKVCQFWRLAVQVSLRAVRPVPAQQGLEARHLPREARLPQGERGDNLPTSLSPSPQRPPRTDNFSVPPQLSEPQHSHIPSSFLLLEQEHLRGIVDKLSVYYLTSSRHFNFANRYTSFSPRNIMYVLWC